jgi:branched-chain amino acid transport system permease protein
MGIPSGAYKLSMLSLGAAIAGLAGALEAHFTFMVAPNGFAFSRVVDMLVYAVVGGSGAVYGPVVGAGFLTLLPEVLREAAPMVGIEPGPLRLAVNGVVLLLVILFLPNGIVSLAAVLRARRAAARPPGETGGER